jgi:hypothetical protein
MLSQSKMGKGVLRFVDDIIFQQLTVALFFFGGRFPG